MVRRQVLVLIWLAAKVTVAAETQVIAQLPSMLAALVKFTLPTPQCIEIETAIDDLAGNDIAS